MMLVDANLLLYSYHQRAREHDASRRWLENTLTGSQLVRFAWITVWAFLRVSTNPRAFQKPLSIREAGTAVESWLSRPNAGILEPGDRHWEILRDLMQKGQAGGPLIMDAVLASIAIEHGATLNTTDRDFARFPGLKWTNPLGDS